MLDTFPTYPSVFVSDHERTPRKWNLVFVLQLETVLSKQGPEATTRNAITHVVDGLAACSVLLMKHTSFGFRKSPTPKDATSLGPKECKEDVAARQHAEGIYEYLWKLLGLKNHLLLFTPSSTAEADIASKLEFFSRAALLGGPHNVPHRITHEVRFPYSTRQIAISVELLRQLSQFQSTLESTTKGPPMRTAIRCINAVLFLMHLNCVSSLILSHGDPKVPKTPPLQIPH